MQTLQHEQKISFTQLEVHKKEHTRNVDYYELIMNFDVQPKPDPNNPVNLQYAIYDEQNQIIQTMVLGYRKYPIGSGVYPKFSTTSKNITVVAWLTGNTLVGRYDILGTTNAKEFNRISDVATKTIQLYNPPIVPPPAPVQIPEPLSEPSTQLIPEIIQSAYAEPEIVVPDPTGLHPDAKWMVLGILATGLLFAIIFLRRK